MRLTIVPLLLVLAAGCINIASPEIEAVHTTETDISDLAEVTLYYKPPRPVEPGETFMVKLEARNMHGEIDLEEFVCNINDDSIFTLVSPPYEPDTLFRNSRRFYSFELSVPSRELVVNNLATAIGYKCTYSHTASSTLIYAVYSKETYNEYIDQGRSMTAYTSLSYGEGPLKIDMEIGESNVVRQGTEDILEIVMRNTGSSGFVGTVQGFRNYLVPGSLEIWIEREPLRDCPAGSLSGNVECMEAERDGKPYCKCTNVRDIRFIAGESEPVQIRLGFRDDVTDHVRQFSAMATARYGYIFEGTVDIGVDAR